MPKKDTPKRIKKLKKLSATHRFAVAVWAAYRKHIGPGEVTEFADANLHQMPKNLRAWLVDQLAAHMASGPSRSLAKALNRIEEKAGSEVTWLIRVKKQKQQKQ